ncbi:C-X-C motif chemokine 15-like [Erinaceus europaeus]|uniref:C-X-C motif chemokine n=1 Tax=Erinaceus europaeus TaxID=9365 RepID=A0ABM3X4V0_ERIEU|nr:C-X-C motif chemokine 15-like [Erinaceus europaeus]
MATKSSLFLLAALVLGILADTSEGQELRCQCIHTHSDFISPKLIKNIQVVPEGPYCNRKEVIVRLKDETLICLDPDAEWVMNIIKKIADRYN